MWYIPDGSPWDWSSYKFSCFIKFNIHNFFYGFSPHEIWSLDYTIAEFIYPRLKHLKKVMHGHPSNVTEEEWNQILDKMIWAFKCICNNYNSSKNKKEQDQRVKEGLDLFRKYYFNLWD